MGKKTASYFTSKFTQYFKRAAKTSVFSIGRPNVEEFSADDWIYIINGNVAYRIAPVLYDLVQPAAMVARPKLGEVVNLGNKILDIETILRVWKSNADCCTYPAVMTPFSFSLKSGDVVDVFSISGAGAIAPAAINHEFIAQLGAPQCVEWFGHSSTGAIMGKVGNGFVECLFMSIRIAPEDADTFTAIAERYRPIPESTQKKEA